MATVYDKYYQTPSLFGEAHKELIQFFRACKQGGRLLDIGCGQGRNALPLARMGFIVTGIDNSELGIRQMQLLAKSEQLSLEAIVADIYAYSEFSNYDYILLDSMFHFAKKDKARELGLLKIIAKAMKPGAQLVVCIQDTGDKVAILK